MAYRHRLRVRYGETDQMGVVHHANYLLYMEEARTMWMAELGCPYGELEQRGIGLPVRRTEMRYRSAARYEDELEVEVAIGRLGGASVDFVYTIRRVADGEVCITGHVDLACVELTAHPRKPRMLPPELREMLERGQG